MHLESYKWSIWVSLRRYRATECEKLTSFKYYGASVSACTFHYSIEWWLNCDWLVSPMHLESHKWSIWVSLRRYRATECEKLTSFKYYGASVSACTFHYSIEWWLNCDWLVSPMHLESHKWSIWVSLRRYRATECEKLTSFKYYGASVSACTFH